MKHNNDEKTSKTSKASNTSKTAKTSKTLKPQKFHFTQEEDSTEKTKGYIAQDLVDSFPEAYPLKDAGEDAGRYFFNPSGMVVYLMKATQEQQTQIEALEAKVKALEEA